MLRDEPIDGVLRLTISNPSKRNALDHAILDGIGAALSDTDARCVVLTGANGTFSSGYDIGTFSSEGFALAAERLVAPPSNSALDLLEAFDRPTVAACSGHMIGGGLELALACDLRVAAEDIKLGMPPAKLGLVYSHTGMRRFIETIGAARTRELFLLGRTIDADAAERWGLVNWLVPSDEVAETALDVAAELASNAPLSVTGNKRLIRMLLDATHGLDATTDAELRALRYDCFFTDDFQEGVRAFAEKRPGRWRGQ